MGNKAPAFQLYSADFFMDTGEWSIDEIGIYTRLLLSEWCNGDLPSEPTRLARIAGCDPKRFKNRWLIVRTKFQLNGNGRLINLRMEEERKKQAKYRELQSQKGKVSAEKRATTVETTVEPRLEPDGQPKGNSSSSSSSSNLKESAKADPQDKTAEEILSLADKLYTQKIFPKVIVFINTAKKEGKSLSTINHALFKCLNNNPRPPDPWAFCQKIVKEDNHKFKHQDNNNMWLGLVDKLKQISGVELRE
jgi:uncharacterized protein YdaU (DUF1376 family)